MTQVIIKARKAGTTDYTDIPVQPSQYNIRYNDISSSTAGRTADGKMYKEKKGTCPTISLSWRSLNDADAGTILALFANEYLDVKYFDIKAAGYLTKEFYVGDRSANCTNGHNSYWDISFNIIARSPLDVS